MKVLYVYNEFPGIYQKYLQIVLESFKKELKIKTLTYKYHQQSDYNIKSYGFLDYFQRLLNFLRLSKFKSTDQMIFNKFEIIHIQHSFLFSKILPVLKLPKKERPKIVITLRGSDTYIKPLVGEKWRSFYQEHGNEIDAFITVSEHQKKYLQKWGVNENKIHVIPVSFGHHSNSKPKYPNQAKLKLVSAFRMTWEKNIEGTIALANQLKNDGIDFSWDIYGEGNDIGQLYFLIDRYSLENYITIKRKILNEKLKAILPTYDFYVQLSVSEALSASVIEAQSVGLPCVVSNSGGLPEAILENQTGICNDYRNTEFFSSEMVKLWKDKERYYKFSENAINFTNENFTIENEIKKSINLYKEIMN